MHEFSVMQQVVASILETLSQHEGVVGVEEVSMDVGELTFLGEEQMRFSFQILCESQPLLKDVKLVVVEKKSLALCPSCGYRGPLRYLETDAAHISIPVFSCPQCNDVVDIVEGRECAITNVRAILDEEDAPKGVKSTVEGRDRDNENLAMEERCTGGE